MQKQSHFWRLLVLVSLLASLLLVPVAFAQEGEATPAGEEDPATAAEAELTDEEPASPMEGSGEEASEAVEAGAVSPLAPLGINSGFLIAQIINFLILFGLLTFALWRPLTNMLDSRAAQIEKGLEDAAAAANARRDAESEAERIRAAARADATRIIEEARSRGEELAKTIEGEARGESDKIRAEGRARATEERDRQLADLRGQVAAISVAVAQRLIGESLDQGRQQALINDFFSKVPEGARGLGGQVEVISAMPLSADEQARVRSEIGSTNGNVTFSVDPGILGGLIIRSEDRVVDGSVRSGLNELAGRLR